MNGGWSELVGKTGQEAQEAISASNPGLKVHIVP